MTFAYMDSGRWMVQPLLGLTTDTLSLYGQACVSLQVVEYSVPAIKEGSREP